MALDITHNSTIAICHQFIHACSSAQHNNAHTYIHTQSNNTILHACIYTTYTYTHPCRTQRGNLRTHTNTHIHTSRKEVHLWPSAAEAGSKTHRRSSAPHFHLGPRHHSLACIARSSHSAMRGLLH